MTGALHSLFQLTLLLRSIDRAAGAACGGSPVILPKEAALRQAPSGAMR